MNDNQDGSRASQKHSWIFSRRDEQENFCLRTGVIYSAEESARWEVSLGCVGAELAEQDLCQDGNFPAGSCCTFPWLSSGGPMKVEY